MTRRRQALTLLGTLHLAMAINLPIRVPGPPDPALAILREVPPWSV